MFTNASAKKLIPHDFATETISMKTYSPNIVLTPLAYDKMYHYIDIATKEVGWFGTVTKERNTFTISDVFLFEQTVSMTETESTSEGARLLAEDLFENRPDEAVDILNNLRFWGHSHVNMSVGPSVQDENQMEELRSSEYPWFIRGIGNKKGEIKFDLFIYDMDLVVEDVPWSLDTPVNDSLRESIEDEFTEKVTEQVGTWQSQQGHQHFYNGVPYDTNNNEVVDAEEEELIMKAYGFNFDNAEDDTDFEDDVDLPPFKQATKKGQLTMLNNV